MNLGSIIGQFLILLGVQSYHVPDLILLRVLLHYPSFSPLIKRWNVLS